MIRVAILGFVGGVGYLQTRASLPDHPALALCAAVALSCGAHWLLRRHPPHQSLRIGLILACGAATGFFWAATLAQSRLAPQLAASDEGRDIVVVGVVDSLPYRFDGGVRFTLALERADGVILPPRLALGWYAGLRGERLEVGAVRPGERWRLTVRLQRPHGNANPHGFDYEIWLLEQGLRATGYVRADPDRRHPNARLDSWVFGVGTLIERCRALLRDRIQRALDGKPYAGVIAALVLGDQRGIEQSDWKVFGRTGINHLVAISGLHITLIAGLFALAASQLWRRSFFTHGQWPLILPAQKVAALSGAGGALLYVLLAGCGVPAQRTLYMLLVVACALWLGRIASVSYVLCAALGIVVLLDPWAVLGPGFWLSFGAVAAILYGHAGRTLPRARAGAPRSLRQRVWHALSRDAQTQYAVTLGLVPLTMLLFAQISLVGPLANMVAIPVVSFVVTPLALAGSLAPEPLSLPLLWLAHEAMRLLGGYLHWLSALSVAVWSAPTPPAWSFCWALLGTAWMLAPRGWPLRWAGAVSWIPLLTALPARPPDGQFWATAFDVGQGMAVLIETRGHRLLYDTGPQYSPGSDGGNRVILPYLKARGVERLDGVIVTHSDIDHAGGALTVLDGLATGWLVSSLRADHPIVLAAPRHRRCEAGQNWEWDGVRFEMLHPTADSYAQPGLKPNARGCTLKVSAGGKSMLLAADIEAAQEAQLLERARSQLRADVLLVPHHGSGTSSTPRFLLAVQPELAVFQVGYRNRYHHPKPAVYQRYGEMGIRRLRTDESGAITLRFGPSLEVEEYRREHARYWYGR